MKSFKKIAALVALLVTAPVLWAAPRSAQEYDQEAQEYKEYWLIASQKSTKEYLEDLRKFQECHPKCLYAYVDLAQCYFQLRMIKDFYEQMKCGYKTIATVPETEEGKFAKAKFYRVSAEARAMIPGYEIGGSPEQQAAICVKNNELIGTQLYYALANFYVESGEINRGGRLFLSAHKYDNDFSLTTRRDVKNFTACCQAKINNYPLLKPYYNKLFSSKKFKYFIDFGAFAASAYETIGEKNKAVLVSMLDKEYTKAYSDTNADELIDILKKHYGSSGKEVAACIDFVQKFFDDEKSLGDADLNSLPQKERDFLTVRYMFKMKNSNDVAALRDEFESFFGTMKQFYIRLLKKAESNGDKDSAAQINKILAEKFQNKKEG